MLDLNVPANDPALEGTVEIRPKAVAEWLERLPLASPADTAQQLVTALFALNRQTLGTDERYALQALYRPVVERVATSLEALLVDAGVPPHAQLRQVGALLRELRIEFSIGYKQMLLSLTNLRFGRPTPKRLAEFTAWLLAALRDVQTACYLTYTPPPAGLWRDMHQLNAYAQASNLDDAAAGAMPPTLAYRQALLLALADPPHMTHAELIHTRLYLGQFAGLAQLGAVPEEPRCGMSIRIDDDTPPRHLAAGQDSGLWLNTEALCRHLHETVVRLRAGGTPRGIGLPPEMKSELSQTLCKRLLKRWSMGAQRAFKRYAATGSTVQGVAGVSAIHRLLERVPQAARLDPEEIDSLPIHDVALVFAAPVGINATEWTVSNDSASGLALSGTPDTPLNLKVGDPLALRADDSAVWSLGVIRWVRMRDARQVELGVERLSPQIQPVLVRILHTRRKTAQEPALFVPGLPALKQPDRLLLPRGLYQAALDAEVWQAPHQITLTFGRRIEHTPSFDLIDFTVFADE